MPEKTLTGRKSTKRKQIDGEEVQAAELPSNGVLEMLSDEEEDGGASSDDGHVDEFPEIINESSSEDSDYEDHEEDSENEEVDTEDTENDENESDDDSDDSLHVFPKAKTIISKITKQPKTVYPEIEPNYDSDSSTEEVSRALPQVSN